MCWLFLLIKHALELFLVVQGTRDGTPDLRAQIMERSETSVKGHCILRSTRSAQCDLLGSHFLSLLESPEVVLDQEGGIELANGHIILT